MNFKWTPSAIKLLDKIKKDRINDFENKTIKLYSFFQTKKRIFKVIPIPYQTPAFQLYIDGKFYGSYFLKNNEWEFLK